MNYSYDSHHDEVLKEKYYLLLGFEIGIILLILPLLIYFRIVVIDFSINNIIILGIFLAVLFNIFNIIFCNLYTHNYKKKNGLQSVKLNTGPGTIIFLTFFGIPFMFGISCILGHYFVGNIIYVAFWSLLIIIFVVIILKGLKMKK